MISFLLLTNPWTIIGWALIFGALAFVVAILVSAFIHVAQALWISTVLWWRFPAAGQVWIAPGRRNRIDAIDPKSPWPICVVDADGLRWISAEVWSAEVKQFKLKLIKPGASAPQQPSIPDPAPTNKPSPPPPGRTGTPGDAAPNRRNADKVETTFRRSR